MMPPPAVPLLGRRAVMFSGSWRGVGVGKERVSDSIIRLVSSPQSNTLLLVHVDHLQKHPTQCVNEPAIIDHTEYIVTC